MRKTNLNIHNQGLTNGKPDEDQEFMTTNQGVRVDHSDNSLKAGNRGPTLMEDFHLRERMTHFDHERIPERIVHARGAAAHGVFRVNDDSLKAFTRARFLTDPSLETEVFVRFSTVAGSRGSADTVRDARGFATKFYTVEGNYDLVGNNMPVFFIQDGIKFPDLVHAVKPEPHNEIPQASAAHDTFWDFISLMPESMHMIFWVLSDRALPRSFAMMEGFGVHTFRLVNEAGEAHFVKFHWKPVAGVHSLTWDETQKLAGKDPDFNRRDLWESIEAGNFPEYELGVQLIAEADEFKFDFDLLDATKIWPEELVPVRIVGKMTLNRNPDNFFAETEQVAFHPGHVVPGIDFTNDPLLQARLFSYLDTQLIRLGGPNFSEIPINRPHVPVHNTQRDGYSRQTVNKGRVAYTPNSLAGGCPFHAGADMGAFSHYAERVDGHKIRERHASFRDHFSQARLFYNSMSEIERDHICEAFQFELGKVEVMEIRERMVGLITRVDEALARKVAAGIGVTWPVQPVQTDTVEPDGQNKPRVVRSEVLSQLNTRFDSIKGRKVAVLVADGFNHDEVMALKQALTAQHAKCEIIAKNHGDVKGHNGQTIKADKTYLTTGSIMYDAVFIPGGDHAGTLGSQGYIQHFLLEAFKHCKPIAVAGNARTLFKNLHLEALVEGDRQSTPETLGVVVSEAADQTSIGQFIDAMKKHRFWIRERIKDKVPA
jgi:catalase